MIYQKYQMMSDLSAPFYLETIKTVFQQHLLPKGELTYRGRFCLGIKNTPPTSRCWALRGIQWQALGWSYLSSGSQHHSVGTGIERARNRASTTSANPSPRSDGVM